MKTRKVIAAIGILVFECLNFYQTEKKSETI
jgi:hypothetical protein